MSCVQTLKGIASDCASSQGGVKAVYLCNQADVSAVTIDHTANTISGITMVSGATFKNYYFRKNNASFTSNFQSDDTGNRYWQTDVYMRFARMDAAKHLEMQALSLGDLAAIVLDANGKWWFVGLNNPLTLNSGVSQTGQQRSDGNFYEATLQDESDFPPYEITDAAAKAVVGDVSASGIIIG